MCGTSKRTQDGWPGVLQDEGTALLQSPVVLWDSLCAPPPGLQAFQTTILHPERRGRVPGIVQTPLLSHLSTCSHLALPWLRT